MTYLIPSLSFTGQCEEAFAFYATALQASNDGLNRYSEMPTEPGNPLDPHYANQIMHTSLSKDGVTILMGADVLPVMSPEIIKGNNVEICIMPDSRAEADRVFAALSTGGEVSMPMEDQFWGDYFGACMDKYGVRWMINCSAK